MRKVLSMELKKILCYTCGYNPRTQVPTVKAPNCLGTIWDIESQKTRKKQTQKHSRYIRPI